MSDPRIPEYYPTKYQTDPSCPLDDFFGESFTPSRIDPTELQHVPNSLMQLDDDTAPLLKAYMETASKGLALPRALHSHAPILWVMDVYGHLFLAAEEVFDSATTQMKYPRARHTDLSHNEFRLGHPALVSAPDKQARIGGELYFDPDYEGDGNGWVINEFSGRYGRSDSRQPTHLGNVSAVFRAYSILVDIYQP